MTTIREMLQEIIEMRAPYSQDPETMAEIFWQHAKYATKILKILENLPVQIDRELDDEKPSLKERQESIDKDAATLRKDLEAFRKDDL